MNLLRCAALFICLPLIAGAADLGVTGLPATDDFILFSAGKIPPAIFVGADEDRAVRRAAGDLADDFARVTGARPVVENEFSAGEKTCVIVGTIGKSEIIDRLAAAGKLDDKRHQRRMGKLRFADRKKSGCRAWTRRWSSRAATGAGRFTAFINCRK